MVNNNRSCGLLSVMGSHGGVCSPNCIQSTKKNPPWLWCSHWFQVMIFGSGLSSRYLTCKISAGCQYRWISQTTLKCRFDLTVIMSENT